MNYIVGAVALLISLSAEPIGYARDGSSDACGRAVRILAIGGEIQPNTWPAGCGSSASKGNNGRHLGWAAHQRRQDFERANYQRRQDDNRHHNDEMRRHRDSEAKQRRDDESRKRAEVEDKRKEDMRRADDERARRDAKAKNESEGHRHGRK